MSLASLPSLSPPPPLLSASLLLGERCALRHLGPRWWPRDWACPSTGHCPVPLAALLSHLAIVATFACCLNFGVATSLVAGLWGFLRVGGVGSPWVSLVPRFALLVPFPWGVPWGGAVWGLAPGLAEKALMLLCLFSASRWSSLQAGQEVFNKNK